MSTWEDCRPRCSYKSLLGDAQVLNTEYKRSFTVGAQPYSVIYDEDTKRWIIAEKATNQLRSFHPDREDGVIIKAPNYLKSPTALTPFNPGRQFAVLDHQHISVYDKNSQSFITIANVNNYRGLGITNRGEFVTVSPSEVFFFSPKVPNKILHREPYIVNGRQGTSPCFLDVSRTKICITDLDKSLQAFTLYDFDSRTLKLTVRKQAILNGMKHDQIQFIAGVRFDANEEFIIVDAKGNKFMYYDQQGNFKHRVINDKPFKMTNSFFVNHENYMMSCEYHNSSLNLYQLKGVDHGGSFLRLRNISNTTASSSNPWHTKDDKTNQVLKSQEPIKPNQSMMFGLRNRVQAKDHGSTVNFDSSLDVKLPKMYISESANSNQVEEMDQKGGNTTCDNAKVDWDIY